MYLVRQIHENTVVSGLIIDIDTKVPLRNPDFKIELHLYETLKDTRASYLD